MSDLALALLTEAADALDIASLQLLEAGYDEWSDPPYLLSLRLRSALRLLTDKDQP